MKTTLLALSLLCACSAPPAPTLHAEPEAPVVAPTTSSTPTATQVGQELPPPKNAFRIKNPDGLVGIAGSGDNLFFSVGRGHCEPEGHVVQLTRAGDALSHRGPGTQNVRVFGQGAQLTAIAVGGSSVAIFRSGGWEYRLVPAIEAETIASATFDDTGELYAAGDEHALYVLSSDGLSWRTIAYTMQMGGIRAALNVGGAIRLVQGTGEVHEYAGGNFKKVPIHGLAVGSLAQSTKASWVDEKRKTVWLAGGKSLTVVDVQGKQAAIHKSALFFDVDTIGGADTPKGTLVVVGTFGDAAVFDGKDFYELDKDGADAVFVDTRYAHAYLIERGRVKIVDIKHPWLGTGSSPVLPPR
jgi:hypothetical protein